LFDSLQGFAYVDDEQITDEVWSRRYDKDNPRVEVTITII
jgi:Holliday junction resolvase RusA-like endonuclease